MKCLFVYTDIHTRNFHHFQHGIGSISAVLKAAGHETALLYLQQDLAEEEFVRRVAEHKPRVVGFSTGTHQWQFARKYSNALKRAMPEILTVCGSHHATLASEEVIAQPGINIVCRGEGEFPLRDLMAALENGSDYSRIQNLWVKRNGEIVRNDFRPLIDPLDQLPYEDRELFARLPVWEQTNYEPTLFCGRGCPFNCTYCCNNALMRLYKDKGKFVRLRSPENVMGELQQLVDRYTVKSFFFEDDTFTLNHDWVREFCRLYTQRFKLPFRIYIRVETATREIMTLLRDAGCYMVNIGLESGNPEIRARVMNRKMTNEEIIETFRICDDLGIKTFNFNLIGVPGDTVKSIEDTIELNRVVRPTHAQVSIFYPYPGTELHHYCLEHGYFPETENVSFFDDSPLTLPTITKEQIRELHNRFETLALEIQAEKEKAGYYDMLHHLGDARITGDKTCRVQLVDQLVGYESRLSLFAHPKSNVTYRADIRPDSVLRFGIAIDPQVWDKCREAIYEVSVKKGLRSRKVFERMIDPRNRPEDRKWHDFEVDLGQFAGGASITLTTTTLTKDKAYCWAVWSRPCIDSKENRNG
jgi:radical SAM superfamily enzyme YgiQ (UPF0313 family)